MARKIEYSEPGDYFPKEIRDKIFGKAGKTTAKKSTRKTAPKKKK